MRAVVQRVTRASVSVNGELVNEISDGLLVFLGITTEDKPEIADRLADKIRKLRIFDDTQGQMNNPISPDQEILCISQFTLYGDTRKGNRPSYITAARPEVAEPLYDYFCEKIGAKKGIFGTEMQVELINDGPVTLLLNVK